MPLTKLTSLGITDGTIVNADINASAAIAQSKITGSFGKVLQVISATDSTERSTTSSSFVTASNTLSVSITPSSTSNKIFIITNFNSGNSSGSLTKYTIYRGATNLGATEGMVETTQGNAALIYTTACMSILDSPSSTSSLTYQVYVKCSGGTAYINKDSLFGAITAFEIAG